MDTQLGVAILSGGLSSRFGGKDKQTLFYDDLALGRRVALNALSTGLPVQIVGPFRSIYDGLDLEFTADVIPSFGPLSGLHAALLKSSASWLYLLACDMPNFHMGWFSFLKEQAREDNIRSALPPLAILAKKSEYIEPFHAFYSRNLIPELEKKMKKKAEEGKKLSFFKLLEDLPHLSISEDIVRRFSPDWDLFTSINDPETLTIRQKKGEKTRT